MQSGYEILPSYLFEDCFDFLIYFRSIDSTIFKRNRQHFDTLYPFIFKLISSSSALPNPHLRAKFVSLLVSILQLNNRNSICFCNRERSTQ